MYWGSRHNRYRSRGGTFLLHRSLYLTSGGTRPPVGRASLARGGRPKGKRAPGAHGDLRVLGSRLLRWPLRDTAATLEEGEKSPCSRFGDRSVTRYSREGALPARYPQNGRGLSTAFPARWIGKQKGTAFRESRPFRCQPELSVKESYRKYC